MQNQSRSSSKKSTALFLTGVTILLTLGVVSLIGFGAMLHLTCSRTDAVTTCRTHVSFMGIIPLSTEQIYSNVRRAEVVESCSDTTDRYLCSFEVDVTYANSKFLLNSHFFSEPSAREVVEDINLLKEAQANEPGLHRNIQNRSILALGWLCVSAPFLILGVLLYSAGINQIKSERLIQIN
jgi:hypothetical protein